MKFPEYIKPFWFVFTKHNHLNFKVKLSLVLCLLQLFILKRVTKKNTIKIKFGRFKISAPDAKTASILLKEKFIFEEYFFESETKNPVIIDCGSSIGISILYFKTIYPLSEIHAFEPNPHTFVFLKENMIANDIKNVCLEETAISGSKGIANLNIHKSNPYLNSLIESNPSPGTISVNSNQLSSYLLNFSHIDLIKLDVEGKEFEILHDLYTTQILKKVSVKNFIIEYHYPYSNNKENLQRFIFMFETMGYFIHKRFSIYSNNPDEETFFFSHK